MFELPSAQNKSNTNYISDIPPENFSPRCIVPACFIAVRDQYLFLKRQPNKSEGNTWGIPGGKLEKDETLEECVIREVKEETGIHISPTSLTYFGKVYIRFPEYDYEYHMYGYKLIDFPEKIVIDTEGHSEYRWMTLREALTVPLMRAEDECIYHVYGENP